MLQKNYFHVSLGCIFLQTTGLLKANAFIPPKQHVHIEQNIAPFSCNALTNIGLSHQFPHLTYFSKKSESYSSLKSSSFIITPTPTNLTENLQIPEMHERFSTKESDEAVSRNNLLDLNLLIIDNFDSYTYNLYQYFSEICIRPPKVIKNNNFDEYYRAKMEGELNGIIISPGPGNPMNDMDVGVCKKAILENPHLPIFGVCLGHQLLGHLYNANVTRAPIPMHGLICNIHHNESHDDYIESDENSNVDRSSNGLIRGFRLFKDIPDLFNATRYHSLIVNMSPKSDVEAIAWASPTNTINNTLSAKDVMALRHKHLPHWGVQFHPESVGTDPFGRRMIRNFCEFAYEYKNLHQKTPHAYDYNGNNAIMRRNEMKLNNQNNGIKHHNKNTKMQEKNTKGKYKVLIHQITSLKGSQKNGTYAQKVFEAIYSKALCSFWLDSSSCSASCPQNSRFSIMGANDGPQSRIIEYYGKEDHSPCQHGIYVNGMKTSKDEDSNGGILDYLRKHMKNEMTQDVDMIDFPPLCSSYKSTEYGTDRGKNGKSPNLPFDYRGGYVGYLGYEVYHDTTPMPPNANLQRKKANKNIPTSAFMFVDRSLVLDHLTGDIYLVGVSDCGENEREYEQNYSATIDWMKSTTQKLGKVYSKVDHDNPVDKTNESHESDMRRVSKIGFRPSRSKSTYQNDIKQCHEEICNGESYELCLTNHLKATLVQEQNTENNSVQKMPQEKSLSRMDPFGFYKVLRQQNPAPYGAFMKFDANNKLCGDSLESKDVTKQGGHGSVAICCSSPERFLSVLKQQQKRQEVEISTSGSIPKPSFIVESKPIKGTSGRPHLEGREEISFQVESKPIKGTCCRGISEISMDENDECNNNQKGGTMETANLNSSTSLHTTNYSSHILENDAKFRSLKDMELAQELQSSIKNRAENLMIVDLLRNDLNRICKVGSVHVPYLMEIESYETVHQMVSTIRGELMDGCTAIDTLEACFPGGSMTGAPKVRTVQILDQKMERGTVRGPYAGSLGYLSLDGCMDMNIIIRTAVMTPSSSSSPVNDVNDSTKVNNYATVNSNNRKSGFEKMQWGLDISIGAGGAITALSESEDEYNEMLLKARAVMDAVNIWSENMGLRDGHHHPNDSILNKENSDNVT